MEHEKQIEALIEAGNKFPFEVYKIEADGIHSESDFICGKILGFNQHIMPTKLEFIAQAANARPAIEAMYAQNKRLREANKAALDWFSVAMKGDIMAAPDAGLIMRKLQQALKGGAE